MNFASALKIFGLIFFVGIFVFLFLTFISGCIDKKTIGDQSTYTFSLWVIPATVLVGIFVMLFGYWIRNFNTEISWTSYFGGFGLSFLIAPALYHDTVIVDPRHVETRYGFGWLATQEVITFADYREVRTVTRNKGGEEMSHPDYHWVPRLGGKPDVLTIANLVQPALAEIRAHAQAAGVRIVEDGN